MEKVVVVVNMEVAKEAVMVMVMIAAIAVVVEVEEVAVVTNDEGIFQTPFCSKD